MPPLHYDDHELDLVAGQTIFDYADSLKVRVPTSCRRSGQCHECIVEIRWGMEALSAPSAAEKFLRDNYRLACQATVVDTEAAIEFALLRRQPKILTQAIHRRVELEPAIVRREDQVFYRGKPLDRYRGRILGLAVDLGTTTVVFNLVDLEDGRVLYTGSFENPQKFGGSDIMHRISYDGGEFHGELHQAIIAGLNYEIRDMCRRLGLRGRLIYELIVVGNAAMRDVFFGMDVQSIGQRPYKSITEHELERGERDTTALHKLGKELGLQIFPKGHIYGGPLIGCHVGADVAADLLAIEIDREDKVVVLVDVGTNTEVVVGNRARMIAASCPAGPAFEGGGVTFGMAGYEGAVESVRIENGEVQCGIIGNVAPRGICGSGLIDLLAELRRTRRMNELGAFEDGGQEFVFVPEHDMSLSRADISALAQAKSANYSGQRITLRRYGVDLDQIHKLYLAGGFANYINVASAVQIGFLPDLARDRIVKVGNASLEGATIMLLSQRQRDRMEEVCQQIEHVELETTPDFFEIFVEGCLFKPMSDALA